MKSLLMSNANIILKTKIMIRNNSSTNEFKPTFKTLKIGLTGSIGMGKSSISKQFKRLGFPVFDADECVHQLYSKDGKAIESIRSILPDVIIDNAVNRPLLMNKIMNDSMILKHIESIVHPLVIKEREMFYEKLCNEEQFMVIYDIPLLFENRAKYDVDYIIVATANYEEQKKRVLNREGYSMIYVYKYTM